MKQINYFNPSRLRNEQSFGFLQKVDNSAQALLTSDTSKPLANAFHAALIEYDNVLELGRKNSFTSQQEEADRKFDQIYTNAYALARIIPHHPTADVAAVGVKLLETFDKYGQITRLGYTEEYALAHHLLQDLETLPQEQLAQMGFTPWQEALTIAKAEFQILRESKQFEDANTATGIVKEKRILAEDAYQTLVTKVNAMVVFMGEDELAPFIDIVNTYIKEMQDIIKVETTRNAKKDKQEDEENSNETEGGETTEEQQ